MLPQIKQCDTTHWIYSSATQYVKTKSCWQFITMDMLYIIYRKKEKFMKILQVVFTLAFFELQFCTFTQKKWNCTDIYHGQLRSRRGLFNWLTTTHQWLITGYACIISNHQKRRFYLELKFRAHFNTFTPGLLVQHQHIFNSSLCSYHTWLRKHG